MAPTGRKRPWLAALLAFLYPGLGHLYLRALLRALLWFGLSLTAAVLLVPQSAVPTELSVDAAVSFSRNLPLDVTLSLLVIRIFNTVDAYVLATRQETGGDGGRADAADGETCPSCGKELDADLEFCHWCTTRLDGPGEDAEAGVD